MQKKPSKKKPLRAVPDECPGATPAPAPPSSPALADWQPADPVMILRTCSADGTSYGGFQWPLTPGAVVEALDWSPAAECGNGLHGWLWGSGDWDLRSKDPQRVWMVCEAEKADVVGLGGKVKFPRARVLFVSACWWEAMAFLRRSEPYKVWSATDLTSASATGDSGHTSATGESGHASATGLYGHASATGLYGHASATGDSGHASATGESGHASATGFGGHASATGFGGHASATGYGGHASATGFGGHASATGFGGHASATGDSGHASATGYGGHASATGDSGHASATGYGGHASATGYCGHASATGFGGHASATGYCGHASATGFGGHASATGASGCSVALGYSSRGRCGADGLLALTWNDGTRRRLLVGYAGEDGIQAKTWYVVKVVDGAARFEEVPA